MKAHEHRIQLVLKLQLFGNKCFPTLAPPQQRENQRSNPSGEVRTAGSQEKQKQPLRGCSGPYSTPNHATDSWEHQAGLGTEASPLPSHQQGAPSNGGWGSSQRA